MSETFMILKTAIELVVSIPCSLSLSFCLFKFVKIDQKYLCLPCKLVSMQGPVCHQTDICFGPSAPLASHCFLSPFELSSLLLQSMAVLSLFFRPQRGSVQYMKHGVRVAHRSKICWIGFERSFIVAPLAVPVQNQFACV